MYEDDRGAYTPPIREPLSFDARPSRARRPAPMTLVASGVILVVLAAAVVVFYRSGVRGANEPPRAVGHSVARIKTPAIENAKPVDDGAIDVYVTDKPGSAAQPSFTAPPEQPQPRPAVTAVQAQVASVPKAAAVQIASAPPSAKAAPAKSSPPASRPVVVATAPEEEGLKPVVNGGHKAATPPAAPPAKTASAAPAKGAAMVQIGAYSSAAIADQEYAKVKGAFAKFASGHGKHVEPVDRGGSTLYRTAFTGFSKADAQAFCAALKAAGRTCIVK
jgi:hypothetical protein